MFDIDSDGVLNVDEIKEMINILLFVSKSGNNSIKNYTYEQVLADLQHRPGRKSAQDTNDVSTGVRYPILNGAVH